VLDDADKLREMFKKNVEIFFESLSHHQLSIKQNNR